MGNLEELINWRIQLNHVIWNKLCKSLERQFDMAMDLSILGVLDEEEEESSRVAEMKKKMAKRRRKKTRDRVLHVRLLQQD
eukprot:5900847-Ditylum_brightwellii.AAC.1